MDQREGVASSVRAAVNPVQILVIEENESEFGKVRKALGQIGSIACEVHWERSYDDGLAALLGHRIDVCLLGCPSGARCGLELPTILHNRRCTTAVIVLTNGMEPGLAERSLEYGADDYIDRADLCPRILERRLRTVLEQHRTHEAMRSLEMQLRQAQKLQAVGTLAGGIAHDFNNILSVILSYSTLLDEELDPDDPRREDLQQIQGAAQRAAELTQQLLAFSRNQVLQPQLVELTQRLNGARKMLRRLLKENIDLTILPRAAGRVFVDPVQVEQVLLNLTVNAADAMPVGGRLTIETDDVDLTEEEAAQYEDGAAGPYVRLTVRDTGVGIPKEIQSRIFEPFFTTKERGKGTGLGLATVFGIVHQSGGLISVESELGEGTAFKIFFPRVASAELTSQATTSGTVAVRGAGRILIVEDDDFVRNAARDVLSRAGYTVLLARNADEALLVSERCTTTIDLLLTDVVMPHMSGRDLADRLVRIRPSLKVLYMSGYTDNAIVHHGVLDPGLSLLRKPFTSDALTARVREVLESSGVYDRRTGTSG